MSSIVSKTKRALFGAPSRSGPVRFSPDQLRSPERAVASRRTTPFLTEQALGGVDPGERQRLKTRAFEDIGLSTKESLGNLREIFGRTGVRGGVQGSDVSDILEAAIGAKGAAGTDIERLLKGESQQKIQNLLALLTSQEPFSTPTSKTGAKKGLFDFVSDIASAAKTFA